MNIAIFKEEAKWNADVARREAVAEWIDYYNNNQEYYLKKALRENYPKSAADMYKYIMTYPLTQRIIDDISMLFKNGVEVTLDKEKLNEILQEILENIQFQPVLDTVNALVNLTHKVGVIPQWRDGLELDIITPDKCFVVQNDDNPTKIDELYYQVGIVVDSPGKSERVDEYVRWTPETQSVVEVKDGRIANERDIIENRFKEIPVTFFTNCLNVDSFWHDKGQPIVHSNKIVNQELTNYRLMIAYQAFSTLVAVGLSEESNIPFGPQFSLKLPFDPSDQKTPDAKYITPNPALEKVWNVINDIILHTAQSVGLSAESFQRQASSFSSGYQLKLSKQDVVNKTIQDRQYYRIAIKDLIENICKLYTWEGDKTFPDKLEISVDFGEIEFETSPKEREELRAMQLNNGTASVIDFIMEDNPDLTREQAVERYKEIEADKGKYVIGGLAESMGVE